MDVNATTVASEGLYDFMLQPVGSWSYAQMAMFPALFIIPAEILAVIIDWMIANIGTRPPLPDHPTRPRKELGTKDLQYIWFNRIFVLPIISFLTVRMVGDWAAHVVVWDFAQLNFWNTVVAFIVCFSLSDLTYYIGHRVVHSNPVLYNYIHKHHHGDSHPFRGWYDTCNAHPTDFFYTGFSTSPVSVLWLMPTASVHIVTIGFLLYVTMFVGALGHCRLDLNIYIFNTRFHAGHHSMFKYNYAQNIELWDRLFGTYKELPMNEAAEVKKVK